MTTLKRLTNQPLRAARHELRELLASGDIAFPAMDEVGDPSEAWNIDHADPAMRKSNWAVLRAIANVAHHFPTIRLQARPPDAFDRSDVAIRYPQGALAIAQRSLYRLLMPSLAAPPCRRLVASTCPLASHTLPSPLHPPNSIRR